MSYAAFRYFADEDAVSILCASCGATEVESKGARRVGEIVRWMIARHLWTLVAVDPPSGAPRGAARKVKLYCTDCARAIERKKTAAGVSAWIKRKRAEATQKRLGVKA